MKVDNPYLEQKKMLIRKLDEERDPKMIKYLQSEYLQVEDQIRQYNQDLLQKLKDTIEIKLERTDYVERELQISPRKQYKEAIKLYRNAIQLVKDIRHLKKEIRENLHLSTQKNKIQKTKIDRWLK